MVVFLVPHRKAGTVPQVKACSGAQSPVPNSLSPPMHSPALSPL